MQPPHISTCSPASAASPWLPLGLDSEPSPSAKSSRTAAKSSRRTSGQCLPTLRANDSEKRDNVANDPRNGLTGFCQHSIPTFDTLTEPDTEESICSQQEFPASPRVAPGSDEARRMTAGSGRKLFESLVKPSRLSPCLKTLLGCLLLSPDWCSKGSWLEWRPRATKSARRLSFQLAASRPITTDTGFLSLPTLCAEDLKRGRSAEECLNHPYSLTLRQLFALMPSLSATELNGGGQTSAQRKIAGHHVRLRDYLKTLPSLAARDWKSEKSNQHGKNARPLSEVIGTMPSLRANKRGVPDGHGNAEAWSGLKLTSNFCEAYQGFPLDWTAIDEPESTPSATRSCRRKSSQSSKPSAV